MLKAPTFIQAFRYVLFLPAFEIGSVEHGDLDPGAMVGD